jgi:hypothetical protein
VGIFEDRSPIKEEPHAAIAHLAIPAKINYVVSAIILRKRWA